MRSTTTICQNAPVEEPAGEIADVVRQLNKPHEPVICEVKQFHTFAKAYFPNQPKATTSKRLKSCAERAIKAASWKGDYQAKCLIAINPKTGDCMLRFLSADNQTTFAHVVAKPLISIVDVRDEDRLDVSAPHLKVIWNDYSPKHVLDVKIFQPLLLLKQVMETDELNFWQPLLQAKIETNAPIVGDICVGLWLKHFPHDCAIIISTGNSIEEIFAFHSNDFQWELEVINIADDFIQKSLDFIDTGERFEQEGAVIVARDDKSICSACGDRRTAEQSPMSRCARCKNARYCSKECQTRDWPVHRNFCKPT